MSTVVFQAWRLYIFVPFEASFEASSFPIDVNPSEKYSEIKSSSSPKKREWKTGLPSNSTPKILQWFLKNHLHGVQNVQQEIPQNFLEFFPKNMFQSAGDWFHVFFLCGLGAVTGSTAAPPRTQWISFRISWKQWITSPSNSDEFEKINSPKVSGVKKKSPKKPSLKFYHHLKFHKNTCSRHLVALCFHLPHLGALL